MRRRRAPARHVERADYPSWLTLASFGSLLLPLAAHGDATLPRPKPRKETERRVFVIREEIVVDDGSTGTRGKSDTRIRPQPPAPPPPVMLGGVAPMPEYNVDPPLPPPKPGDTPAKACPRTPPKPDAGKKDATPPKPADKEPIIGWLHPHDADQPCFIGGERVFRLRRT